MHDFYLEDRPYYQIVLEVSILVIETMHDQNQVL